MFLFNWGFLFPQTSARAISSLAYEAIRFDHVAQGRRCRRRRSPHSRSHRYHVFPESPRIIFFFFPSVNGSLVGFLTGFSGWDRVFMGTGDFWPAGHRKGRRRALSGSHRLLRCFVSEEEGRARGATAQFRRDRCWCLPQPCLARFSSFNLSSLLSVLIIIIIIILNN